MSSDISVIVDFIQHALVTIIDNTVHAIQTENMKRETIISALCSVHMCRMLPDGYSY